MIGGSPAAYEIASGACLDGLCFDVPVDRNTLCDYLAHHGPFRLAEEDAVDDTHPVVCEIWRVTRGRAMPNGIDQLDLVARWMRLMTQAVHAMCSGGLSAAGALASASGSTPATTSMNRARRGAEQIVAFAAASESRATELLALGPYHELFVAVPDVCLKGDGTRCMAVLGMFTDSRIARSIDGWLGYGYDKRPGLFVFEGGGLLAISAGEQAVLAGRFRAPPEGAVMLDATTGRRIDDRWAQPLLGGLHDGRFRRSWLKRERTSAGSWRMARADIHVSFPRALFGPSAKNGEPYRVNAAMFTQVPALISRPVHL